MKKKFDNNWPFWVIIMMIAMFTVIYLYAYQTGRMEGLNTCLEILVKSSISNPSLV